MKKNGNLKVILLTNLLKSIRDVKRLTKKILKTVKKTAKKTVKKTAKKTAKKDPQLVVGKYNSLFPEYSLQSI